MKMRVSLFLNSTMSSSCARSRHNDWYQTERESSSHRHQPYERSSPNYGASSKEKSVSFCPTSKSVSRTLPTFLNACYELQWFIQTKTTFTKALDKTAKQISALLLCCLALVLFSAQLAGLAMVLSAAPLPLPFGLQFLLAAFTIIVTVIFKVMY